MEICCYFKSAIL